MEAFKNNIKTVLTAKIEEKKDTDCYGCILGLADRSQHYCDDTNDKNIERFFNSVFSTYVYNNRKQVLAQLKKAMMVEMLADYMERHEAEKKAADNRLVNIDITGVCSETVTSTTDQDEN